MCQRITFIHRICGCQRGRTESLICDVVLNSTLSSSDQLPLDSPNPANTILTANQILNSDEPIPSGVKGSLGSSSSSLPVGASPVGESSGASNSQSTIPTGPSTPLIDTSPGPALQSSSELNKPDVVIGVENKGTNPFRKNKSPPSPPPPRRSRPRLWRPTNSGPKYQPIPDSPDTKSTPELTPPAAAPPTQKNTSPTNVEINFNLNWQKNCDLPERCPNFQVVEKPIMAGDGWCYIQHFPPIYRGEGKERRGPVPRWVGGGGPFWCEEDEDDYWLLDVDVPLWKEHKYRVEEEKVEEREGMEGKGKGRADPYEPFKRDVSEIPVVLNSHAGLRNALSNPRQVGANDEDGGVERILSVSMGRRADLPAWYNGDILGRDFKSMSGRLSVWSGRGRMFPRYFGNVVGGGAAGDGYGWGGERWNEENWTEDERVAETDPESIPEEDIVLTHKERKRDKFKRRLKRFAEYTKAGMKEGFLPSSTELYEPNPEGKPPLSRNCRPYYDKKDFAHAKYEQLWKAEASFYEPLSVSNNYIDIYGNVTRPPYQHRIQQAHINSYASEMRNRQKKLRAALAKKPKKSPPLPPKPPKGSRVARYWELGMEDPPEETEGRPDELQPLLPPPSSSAPGNPDSQNDEGSIESADDDDDIWLLRERARDDGQPESSRAALLRAQDEERKGGKKNGKGKGKERCHASEDENVDDEDGDDEDSGDDEHEHEDQGKGKGKGNARQTRQVANMVPPYFIG